MTERLLVQTLTQSTTSSIRPTRPPVWMMRQAGRYHSHYQNLRRTHSFVDLCKKPEISCEAAMGPIRDFDFDAAILFSDLLFPLEVMGMDLSYETGGPKLGGLLSDLSLAQKLNGGASLAQQLDYQAQAILLLRRALSPEKALIGFVGGPLTLFAYAVDGSHKVDPNKPRNVAHALRDGRFEVFCERLTELLGENMFLQHQAGSDVVAMLDTYAGEVSLTDYQEIVLPATRRVLEYYSKRSNGAPVLYYSKGTGPAHWELVLRGLPKTVRALGVDWNEPLSQTLRSFSARVAIQGNFDPHEMLKPWKEIEPDVRKLFESVRALGAETYLRWICGLGHGLLPKTPEENVRNFVRLSREVFRA